MTLKNYKAKQSAWDIKNSQNFLHDTKLVHEIVAKSNITKNDTVYEIGPGKGIVGIRNLPKTKTTRKSLDFCEWLFLR